MVYKLKGYYDRERRMDEMTIVESMTKEWTIEELEALQVHGEWPERFREQIPPWSEAFAVANATPVPAVPALEPPRSSDQPPANGARRRPVVRIGRCHGGRHAADGWE